MNDTGQITKEAREKIGQLLPSPWTPLGEQECESIISDAIKKAVKNAIIERDQEHSPAVHASEQITGTSDDTELSRCQKALREQADIIAGLHRKLAHPSGGGEKWYQSGALVRRVGDDALRFEAYDTDQAYNAVERHNATLQTPATEGAEKCPFCGGKGVLLSTHDFPRRQQLWVQCNDCGAQGPRFPKYGKDKRGEDEAWRAWKQRPTPATASEQGAHHVIVTANSPAANELLHRAVKWIDRLCERKKSIPHFFDNDTDPCPLSKDIRKFLSQRPTPATEGKK